VLPILYKFVESGVKKIKMPKTALGMFTVLVVIAGLGISGNANAQDSTITLPQAIERAKENYPAIKAAKLEVDKQEALKANGIRTGNDFDLYRERRSRQQRTGYSKQNWDWSVGYRCFWLFRQKAS